MMKTKDELRRVLSTPAFRVTQEEATENPHSSPLNHEIRHGIFMCVCCGAALFPSDTKFDSGTGWPSFFDPVSAEAIATREDGGFFSKRTEVHCADCAAHLGHVFKDGPKPTGLRYCINGVALEFIVEDEDE